MQRNRSCLRQQVHVCERLRVVVAVVIVCYQNAIFVFSLTAGL